VARIFAAADRLGEFPQLGRVGIVPGAYEWTVTGLPYIIVHEVDDDKDQVVVIGRSMARRIADPAVAPLPCYNPDSLPLALCRSNPRAAVPRRRS
jgi:plasmid stabilization system protein ParE